MSMSMKSLFSKMFTISWEIKDADGISVAIEIPEGTTRLPYEYRKRIVQRLREKLLPPKAKRHEMLSFEEYNATFNCNLSREAYDTIMGNPVKIQDADWLLFIDPDTHEKIKFKRVPADEDDE